MKKTINIGVLGCAAIADRSIIPAIKSLPEYFNLVAIASRNIEKANEFASKFDCNAVEGYQNLIDLPNVDALYLPLPTGLHHTWINKALKAGKHVYAEKSIALNSSEAERMINNAKSNNIGLMEGFMFQYHSQHKQVREIIQSGEIGELRHFSSSFGFPPLDESNFRYDSELGGGALYDAGAYPLRAAFFMLGDNLEVMGASSKRIEGSSSAIYGSAFLKAENGIGASLSFGFDNFYQCFYQFAGSKGILTVDRAFTPRPDMAPTFTLQTSDGIKKIESTPDNHFEKALIEFHSLIIDDYLREKHFKEIIQQSKALEQINALSI